MGKILLFYKYVDIKYPKQIAKWQEKLCAQLGLKGRIILAHEGINATVGGSQENTQRYIQAMNNHDLFGGIDFKESDGDENYFPRMRIVIKNEIVYLGLDTQEIKAQNGGTHLAPSQAHEIMAKKPEDLIIIDCRNTYETNIGTFVGAIKPPTNYFREFPGYVDQNLELFKNKQVLMACTGGIRCERASAYLKAKGVAKEVYQIEGGIQRYTEAFPEGFFRGKNYVFDARITVKINDDVLGQCLLCAQPYDTYENCLNASCNKHFICCPACYIKYAKTCGPVCQELLATNQVKPRPERIKPDQINKNAERS